MTISASEIKNARNLIDRYYGVHLGRELPATYLKSELFYAEELFKRYQSGPEFIDHLVSESVKKTEKDLKRFTDIKGTAAQLGKKLETEWRVNTRNSLETAQDAVKSAGESYKKAVIEFAEQAMKTGRLSEEQIMEFRATADDYAKERAPKVDPSISNDHLRESMERVLASAQESMAHERLCSMVAKELEFDTESQYVQKKLTSMGIKPSQIPSNKPVIIKKQPKTTNTQQQAIGSRTTMSAGIPAFKDAVMDQKVAAEIVVHGYDFNSKRRKHYLIFSTSAFGKPDARYRLYIDDKNSKFDSTKPYQTNIFDKRFKQNNPIGTKLIAELKHRGYSDFETSGARKTKHDVSQGNFTLIQVDQPSGYENMKKRHVAMRWANKAIKADHIFTLRDKFTGSENDLFKTQSSWWGYQLRVVNNGTIIALSRLNVWDKNNETSPTFSSLEDLVRRYQRVYSQKPNHHVEVTICECIKVIPTIHPKKEAGQKMLDTATLLQPNVYRHTQLGGQVMTRGLIEYKRDPKWGLSVVSSSSTLDMPAPNTESLSNHIQSHIALFNGTKAYLNKEIAMSANGKTKQQVKTDDLVTAAPKPAFAEIRQPYSGR